MRLHIKRIVFWRHGKLYRIEDLEIILPGMEQVVRKHGKLIDIDIIKKHFERDDNDVVINRKHKLFTLEYTALTIKAELQELLIENFPESLAVTPMVTFGLYSTEDFGVII